MKRSETSCGAVVFTRQADDIRFVIIRSVTGCYGFPKGHIERGESERQTARREIQEETGLNVTLLDGFRTTESYVFKRGDGKEIDKHVVYFLAEFQGQTPVAQETEIASISLMRYDEAMAVFQFDSSRRILTEAYHFLMQMR